MTDQTAIALQRSLSDVVAEYDEKHAAVGETIAAFETAGVALKTAATIGGTWGNSQINTGSIYAREIEGSLLKSAWRHVYNGLNIEKIASAKDKRLFQQNLENPAPFTLDNIRATFGHYIADPRGNILRGLAEVFCDLDPAFKSHEKIKIGVKGLPKRVIIHIGDYSGWGRDKLRDMLNALAAFQRKPLIEWREMDALLKREDALLHDWEVADATHPEKLAKYPARGVGLSVIFGQKVPLRKAKQINSLHASCCVNVLELL